LCLKIFISNGISRLIFVILSGHHYGVPYANPTPRPIPCLLVYCSVNLGPHPAPNDCL